VAELKSQQAAMQAQQAMMGGMDMGGMEPPPAPTTGGSPMENVEKPGIPGGSGYSQLQRVINKTGDTKGVI
jgi:hypothetical protein